VLAGLANGRATLFRLLTATLKEGRAQEDVARRLRLLTAAGQLVWSKSSTRPAGRAGARPAARPTGDPGEE
jgi:hypothetical protein